MKKTLIALASLACISGASAQVTLTGNLTSGFKATKATGTQAINIPALGLNNVAATAGADAAGLGIDTSEVTVGVAEELGGGRISQQK